MNESKELENCNEQGLPLRYPNIKKEAIEQNFTKSCPEDQMNESKREAIDKKI